MAEYLEKLKQIFKSHNVVLAYLFGSQKDIGLKYINGGKTRIKQFSDLDIGVLLKTIPQDMYKTCGNISFDLSNIFKPFNIDISFLHEISYLLKYDVISGHRIYTANDVFADEYEEKVVKMASDLAFKRSQFEKDFLEALEDGHFEIKLG